jgi:Xaa-Pro aminopeptidase
LGSAILNKDGTAQLFVKPEKVTPELRGFLGNEVSISTESNFVEALKKTSGKRVLVDPSLSSAHVFDALHAAGAQIVRGQDPTILPRALKNAVEIAGTKVGSMISAPSRACSVSRLCGRFFGFMN